eukprot:CAMPEP_0182444142 /NCGR_PEP_ID=MMETSP1172-20130603/2689_1 /TAXON_ID=708627 /ORGANISM="Timspurckia oligopyrenoides, Strain CCMP3278" /LENGTH=530 /DNA_ID=CAMNT_0024639637 /DNA_START=44 /DNA_END=1636 /DNA_ORIENTATION=+
MDVGEVWYGGPVSRFHFGPYDCTSSIIFDLRNNTYLNQAQPLVLSSHGRLIWSQYPFSIGFEKGLITIIVDHESHQIQLLNTHTSTTKGSLQSAFTLASNTFFPASSKFPDETLFRIPQFNTWIELQYNQYQSDILKYAQNIIDHGYSPGILMIDDGWQESYGCWNFNPKKFHDPKGMIEQLHKMGFKVMMWLVPYITPDSLEYRELEKKKYLVMMEQTLQDSPVGSDRMHTVEKWPFLLRWWNGVSGVLDLSNPDSLKWFLGVLDGLQTEYGVDGFKLDGGDAEAYRCEQIGCSVLFFDPESNGNDQSQRFARIGEQYPVNELRASWKLGGQAIAQRLRDKNHLWEDLEMLIPGGVIQGLSGHAFSCPDMIAGGEYLCFLPGHEIDEELFVRSAQASALFPMMQFSAAPWNALRPEYQKICLDCAKLHEDFGDYIMELVHRAAETGEPILRCLEYNYPGNGYEKVMDQFLLGDEILVAPVLQKGANSRTVIFPDGQWKSVWSNTEETIHGPIIQTIHAPIERLPWFRKQ